MRHQTITVRLPYELVQRARYIVKHKRHLYSLVGLVKHGLAKEVSKAERKHGIHWRLWPVRLPAGRRRKAV